MANVTDGDRARAKQALDEMDEYGHFRDYGDDRENRHERALRALAEEFAEAREAIESRLGAAMVGDEDRARGIAEQLVWKDGGDLVFGGVLLTQTGEARAEEALGMVRHLVKSHLERYGQEREAEGRRLERERWAEVIGDHRHLSPEEFREKYGSTDLWQVLNAVVWAGWDGKGSPVTEADKKWALRELVEMGLIPPDEAEGVGGE